MTDAPAAELGVAAIPQLSKEAPTPLYYQLYRALKDAILSGAIAHGAQMPTEQQLADACGVSRITAKRAMDELAGEGPGDVLVFLSGEREIHDTADALRALDDALEQSVEGRAIRERAMNPSPLDLSRHLSAWLGDIPANDLFEVRDFHQRHPGWNYKTYQDPIDREPADGSGAIDDAAEELAASMSVPADDLFLDAT